MRASTLPQRSSVRSTFARSKALSFENAFLDGLEVETVGRQLKRTRVGRFDRILNAGSLVGLHVVHDDDALSEGSQEVLDLSQEHTFICGAVVDEGRGNHGLDRFFKRRR